VTGVDLDYECILARFNQVEALAAPAFSWLCQFLSADFTLYARTALKVATRDQGPLCEALCEVIKTSSDLPLLIQLESQVPAQTVNLRQFAVELGRRIRQLLIDNDDNAAVSCADRISLPDLAKFWNNLALRFSDIGQLHEALPAAESAVQSYAYLADRNPSEFLPCWARALNNLAYLHGQIGQPALAAEKAGEAANIYQLLVNEGLESYWPNLALSLKNRSDWLVEVAGNQVRPALENAEEAVFIFNKLVTEGSQSALPGLAASLGSYSNRLRESGRLVDALQAAQKAHGLYEELVARSEDQFLPGFAVSLHNLANCLSDAQHWEDALTRANEAATIYERLSAQQPSAFLSDQAMIQENLSVILGQLGREHEALEKAETAAKLWQNQRCLRNWPSQFVRRSSGPE
jgi:tetratricopeptide (TPR) repeat protein